MCAPSARFAPQGFALPLPRPTRPSRQTLRLQQTLRWLRLLRRPLADVAARQHLSVRRAPRSLDGCCLRQPSSSGSGRWFGDGVRRDRAVVPKEQRGRRALRCDGRRGRRRADGKGCPKGYLCRENRDRRPSVSACCPSPRKARMPRPRLTRAWWPPATSQAARTTRDTAAPTAETKLRVATLLPPSWHRRRRLRFAPALRVASCPARAAVPRSSHSRRWCRTRGRWATVQRSYRSHARRQRFTSSQLLGFPYRQAMVDSRLSPARLRSSHDASRAAAVVSSHTISDAQ